MNATEVDTPNGTTRAHLPEPLHQLLLNTMILHLTDSMDLMYRRPTNIKRVAQAISNVEMIASFIGFDITDRQTVLCLEGRDDWNAGTFEAADFVEFEDEEGIADGRDPLPITTLADYLARVKNKIEIVEAEEGARKARARVTALKAKGASK
jgi:hypothetical protein